ncbi:MAG: hypothetical protein QXT13_10160 [Pyrobaculum sp.]
MPNIYLGPNSCYARHGLPYVRGQYVTPRTAAAIKRVIKQELRRGWTFDKRTCERIPMTPELAARRIRFLNFLMRVHARKLTRRIA